MASAVDRFKASVKADLEARGVPAPVIALLIQLLGPFLLQIFKACVGGNPKILQRRALEASNEDAEGARLRKKLRRKVENLPITLSDTDRDAFVDSLILNGCAAAPDDYVAVADELEFRVV